MAIDVAQSQRCPRAVVAGPSEDGPIRLLRICAFPTIRRVSIVGPHVTSCLTCQHVNMSTCQHFHLGTNMKTWKHSTLPFAIHITKLTSVHIHTESSSRRSS